ncbi:hypothetical protein M885DRAFT_482135 [Pelagophyceae sp. CCMP2097]|nr:hypothetical protein M885DRAFT_482135 [Pelagophyceae sp. CCMP2097]
MRPLSLLLAVCVPVLARGLTAARPAKCVSPADQLAALEAAPGRPAFDPPAVVVGAGRIGALLASLGPDDAVMTRAGWPANAPAEGPIYVCTRNDALDAVVSATPEHRRGDLVFLQNGMLGDFLEAKGLSDNSVVLVYLAVAKLGEAPTDGTTSENPEGLTTATGKWAPAMQARLAKAGLTCHVREGDDFKVAMLEKHAWICAFMLVGAGHGGCTVGSVESDFAGEFDALATELVDAGSLKLGVAVKPGYLLRLKAYARAVAHFPTAVKEFEWRNGWFFDISKEAVAAGKADPMPLHTKALRALMPELPQF